MEVNHEEFKRFHRKMGGHVVSDLLATFQPNVRLILKDCRISAEINDFVGAAFGVETVEKMAASLGMTAVEKSAQSLKCQLRHEEQPSPSDWNRLRTELDHAVSQVTDQFVTEFTGV